MGIGISLLNVIENGALLAFVGVNIIVVVHLLAKGSGKYLANLPASAVGDISKVSKQSYTDARLRLAAFFTVMIVFATAVAVKLTLPTDLADQIIAAWFVGQGFALQRYVKSYISGIQARNNKILWDALYRGGTVVYAQDKCLYTLVNPTVFSMTLCTTTSSGEKQFRVLPWTEIDNMTITRKD